MKTFSSLVFLGFLSSTFAIDSNVPACPANDGTQYVDPISGFVLQLDCGKGFVTTYGTQVGYNIYYQDLVTCSHACGSFTGGYCQAFSYKSADVCQLYGNITVGPATFEQTSTSTANAVGYVVATSPPAGYFGCPTIGGTTQTFNGQDFKYNCGGNVMGGTLMNPTTATTGSADQCQQLCSSTTDCTGWAVSEHAVCRIYSGTSLYFSTPSFPTDYTAGIMVSALQGSTVTTSTTTTTSSASTTVSQAPLPSPPRGFVYYNAPNGAVFLVAGDTPPSSLATGAVPNKRSFRGTLARRDVTPPTTSSKDTFAACINACADDVSCQEAVYQGTTCSLYTSDPCGNPAAPAGAQVAVKVASAGGGVSIPSCLTNGSFVVISSTSTDTTTTTTDSSSGSSSATATSSATGCYNLEGQGIGDPRCRYNPSSSDPSAGKIGGTYFGLAACENACSSEPSCQSIVIYSDNSCGLWNDSYQPGGLGQYCSGTGGVQFSVYNKVQCSSSSSSSTESLSSTSSVCETSVYAGKGYNIIPCTGPPTTSSSVTSSTSSVPTLSSSVSHHNYTVPHGHHSHGHHSHSRSRSSPQAEPSPCDESDTPSHPKGPKPTHHPSKTGGSPPAQSSPCDESGSSSIVVVISTVIVSPVPAPSNQPIGGPGGNGGNPAGSGGNPGGSGGSGGSGSSPSGKPGSGGPGGNGPYPSGGNPKTNGTSGNYPSGGGSGSGSGSGNQNPATTGYQAPSGTYTPTKQSSNDADSAYSNKFAMISTIIAILFIFA